MDISTKPSLTLKRKLQAPPQKVFEAWTDAKKLGQWMGPEGVKTLEAQTDPRVGGHYRILMQSPGGEKHDVSGVYREVVPNTKLVFTWAWKSTPERESLVTVTLKADGDGTALTLMHEQFFDADARDRHQHGWSGGLDKLEKFLAA